jgi:hypothetical protein
MARCAKAQIKRLGRLSTNSRDSCQPAGGECLTGAYRFAWLAMFVGSGDVSFTIWPNTSPITRPRMMIMGKSRHARPVIIGRPVD